jgi:hypothetical protein
MRILFATVVLIALTAPAAVLAGQASPARPSQGQPPAATAPPATQQPNPPPRQPVGTAGQGSSAAEISVSPSQLGVSVDRIRRELREAQAANRGLLRYDFHVDVYGSGGKVDLFKDFDFSPSGPVRYGGMTHAEFMDQVTPQEFRAPSANLAGVAMLVLQQLAQRERQKQ